MALARGFSASRGSRVSFQLEILDAGRRVQPRGGRRRRRRWTAAAAGREERPHGVDGNPNAVQGGDGKRITVQGGLVSNRPIEIRRPRYRRKLVS